MNLLSLKKTYSEKSSPFFGGMGYQSSASENASLARRARLGLANLPRPDIQICTDTFRAGPSFAGRVVQSLKRGLALITAGRRPFTSRSSARRVAWCAFTKRLL